MGKKDLEIWEEKKRASAKEDGLKSAGPPRRFPCNVCKNLADFLLSVYLAGHITLRKISSMAMAAGIVFLVHALCAFHKALVIFIEPPPTSRTMDILHFLPFATKKNPQGFHVGQSSGTRALPASGLRSAPPCLSPYSSGNALVLKLGAWSIMLGNGHTKNIEITSLVLQLGVLCYNKSS